MKNQHFNFNAEDLLCGVLLTMGLMAGAFVWALILMITEGGGL